MTYRWKAVAATLLAAGLVSTLIAQSGSKSVKTRPKTTAKKTAPKRKAASKSRSTTAKARTKAKSKTKSVRPRYTGQTRPTPERYKQIEQALAARGYLNEEPSGKWGSPSVDALKSFQADNQLPPTGKLDAQSLIQLGLGPRQ